MRYNACVSMCDVARGMPSRCDVVVVVVVVVVHTSSSSRSLVDVVVGRQSSVGRVVCAAGVHTRCVYSLATSTVMIGGMDLFDDHMSDHETAHEEKISRSSSMAPASVLVFGARVWVGDRTCGDRTRGGVV